MTSVGQPSPKAAHYNHQLHAVLLRGAWSESNPGREPNASTAALGWSELLRKFKKHTANDGGLLVVIVLTRSNLIIFLVAPNVAMATVCCICARFA